MAEDPKHRRPSAGLKDRDVRETTKPIEGSPAALAIAGIGRAQSRQQLERQAAVATAFIAEDTKPHATPLESLERTAGKAQAQATIAASETGLLRMEVRQDLKDVNGRVDDLRNDVSELHGDVREIKGAFGELNKHLTEQREERKIRVVTELELGKAETLAEIEERKANGNTRRWAIAKVVTLVVSLFSAGGLIYVLLTQKGC